MRLDDGVKRSDRAQVPHAANGNLGNNNRDGNDGNANKINQNKRSAAVFPGKKRKTPEVAKAYSSPGGGQHKRQL